MKRLCSCMRLYSAIGNFLLMKHMEHGACDYCLTAFLFFCYVCCLGFEAATPQQMDAYNAWWELSIAQEASYHSPEIRRDLMGLEVTIIGSVGGRNNY